MANPEHLAWLQEGVEAWNARREREPFTPDLSRANLNRLDLIGTHLFSVNFNEAILQEASLVGAYLRQARLKAANLQGAKLERADLETAYLQGADLFGANLFEANLQGASLRGTNLTEANLQGASLRGTNLTEANLRGTKLQGANIRTVENTYEKTVLRTDLFKSLHLTQEQVDSMDGDTGVILPIGLDYPLHWPNFGEGPDPRQDIQTGEAPQSPDRPTPLAQRLAETGPVAAVLRDGKIDIVSTPPDGHPAVTYPEDRDHLFDAIHDACTRFKTAWNDKPPQAPINILNSIDACAALSKARDLNWYKWEDLCAEITFDLSLDEHADWYKFDARAERIRKRILELAPHIKPIPLALAPSHLEQPTQAPEIELTPENEDDIPDLKDTLQSLVNGSAKTIINNYFTADTQSFVIHQAETLQREEIPLADPHETRSSAVSKGRWKRALRAMAGFTMTFLRNVAVGVTSGVLGSALTTETAWPHLIHVFEQLRDILLKFFKAG
ncbi:pentapeptide repeat-containing protein [Woodsholea maritima]|uniref:pentapeptide repeat-containing protein n=1 Tax=Woodsholea maritima TaxID=240237 RepID=UPI001F46DC36|nr:pentapeptide repeat-containing protein [Woodsholea maritima]